MLTRPARIWPSESLPLPLANQSPTSYADQLGRWYGDRIDDDHRKRHGHYLTPIPVAQFMGNLAAEGNGPVIRLLDPAAGAGVLAASACESLALAESPPTRIELVLYEIDAGLVPVLEASIAHLQRWLSRRGIVLEPQLHVRDFVLANAGALDASLFPHDENFDAVICNPPYFKLQRSDPRAQACLLVVHGQPNVYGLFMALGAAVFASWRSPCFHHTAVIRQRTLLPALQGVVLRSRPGDRSARFRIPDRSVRSGAARNCHHSRNSRRPIAGFFGPSHDQRRIG